MTMLLTACAQNSGTIIKCPQLNAPTQEVVQRLEGLKGRESQRWVVQLSSHLDKLKECR